MRIIACLFVVVALAQDEQCENGVCQNDGEGQPPSDNVAARFTNERDEDVELHWLSPTGETALMGAAMNGHDATVKHLLFRGADHTLRNAWGETAHQHAETKGHKECARRLL